MHEAKTRKRELARDIAIIEFQLSSKERKHPDGSEFSHKEYRSWRAKAIRKVSLLKYEHAVVTDWIVERRLAIQLTDLEGGDLGDEVTASKVLMVVRKFLAENKDRLEGTKRGELYNLVDLFLTHKG